MIDALELPITLKCAVGGEEWPTTSYKSYCQAAAANGKQTARTVTFMCPAEHIFSLGRAVKAGMFTQAQKKIIVAQAQARADQHWNDVRREFGLTGG